MLQQNVQRPYFPVSFFLYFISVFEQIEEKKWLQRAELNNL